MTWTYKRPHKCPGHYAYTRDPRYQLRQVEEPSGQAPRRVWALFYGTQRIWEVHALGKIGIVRADALDYINAARMAG